MAGLWDLFLSHRGRTVHKWAHYVPAYERHLSRYVNRPCTLLEIGCGEGGSLQLWRRWLGPLARVVGADIRPGCAAYEEEGIAVRIGDASDPAFLDALLDEFGPPDIVLDDGSHQQREVCASFAHLYPRTARDGVYAVEDVHAAYWPEYGGGLGAPGSFLERAKALMDEMHAPWTRGALPATAFTAATLSMHLYDSLLVFERGAPPPRRSLRVPPGGLPGLRGP